MTDALCDIRFALRRLRKAPIFTSVAILTIALGTGGIGALASLVAAMRRPLAIPESNRLVAVSRVNASGRTRSLSVLTLATFSEQQHTLTSVCGYSGGGVFTIDVHDSPMPAAFEFVTGACQTVLGAPPQIGRLIGDTEAPLQGDSAPVAVLGYYFWQRMFGADPRIIGQTIRVEGVPLTVIGVARERTSLQADRAADVVVPIGMLARLGGASSPVSRPPDVTYLIGRLRPDATAERTARELDVLWPSLSAATSSMNLTPAERSDLQGSHLRVESASAGLSSLRQSFRSPVKELLAVAAVLFGLACINVCALQLVRMRARAREFATCVALGARPFQLVRQILTETVLVSVFGAVGGMMVAAWMSVALTSTVGTGFLLPLTIDTAPTGTIWLFVVGLAVAAGMVIGLVPAWIVCGRRSFSVWMSERGVAQTSGRAGQVLVVAQVALCLALVFTAGLLSTSLANRRRVDVGFKADGLLWAMLTPQPGGYRDLVPREYYRALVDRLHALPGVQSAAVSRWFLTGASPLRSVALDGSRAPAIDAVVEPVSPGYFATTGITLVRGRDVAWTDDADRASVAVVNETLARQLASPTLIIGSRVRIVSDPTASPLEIVGLVKDAAVGDVKAPHLPVVYRPFLQGRGPAFATMTVRAASPASVAESARRAVASLKREYALSLHPASDWMDIVFLNERVMATLSAYFAGLALLLAVLGVYGHLAYAVTCRRREIGVRLALGASAWRVLRMIVGQALVLIVSGVAVGIPLALAVGRVVRAALFGLTATDARTLLIVSLGLALVGVLASLLPARRARMAPMIFLRCE